MKLKTVVSAFLVACLLASSAAAQSTPGERPVEEPTIRKASTPFDQGKMYISIGGGYSSGSGASYFVLGAGFGYFVVDGLEAGLGGDVRLGSDPFVGTLTPRLTYYFHQIPFITPYIGGFYSHWFIGSGFEDLNSVGGRAGVVSVNGPLLLSLGVVYERFLGCEYCGDDWYPELSIGFSF